MKKVFMMFLIGTMSIGFLGCGEVTVDDKDKTYSIEKNNTSLDNDTDNNKINDTKFFDDVFAQLTNKNYDNAKKYLGEKNIDYISKDTEGKPKRSVIIVTNPNNDKEKISSLYMDSSKDNFEVITYFKDDKIVSATYIDGKLKFNLNKETYLDSLDEVKEYLFKE